MGGIISGEHRVTKTRTNAQREIISATIIRIGKI